MAALGVVKSAQKKKNVSSRYKFYTDAIIGFATNRGGIECRKSIADFANAFLYEPANEIGEEKVFVHEIKQKLSYYLRSYASNVNTMLVLNKEDSASVSICTFIGEETHEFLSEEGLHKCDLCHRIMCTKCCTPYKDKTYMCLGCYRDTLFINQNTLKSREGMKSELTQNERQIPYDASYLQVLELYEAYKDFDLGVSHIKVNQYPLESAIELDDNEGMFSRIKYTCTIGDLPYACRTNCLTWNDVVNLTCLLAELVRYDTSNVCGKIYDWHKNMPAVLINFAQGARMNSVAGGLKLLKHANRHALHLYEPDIRLACVKIGYYKDQLYLHLAKSVARSYHSNEDNAKQCYFSQCIFSSKDLICTQCECKVGPQGSKDELYETGKHTCKHPPSIIRGLSLELCRGAAEVFLVELDVRIKEEGKSFKERNDFKENISLLAAAAGYRLDTNQSTRVMLEQFCVGTDKTTTYPGDPRPESIRPIREVEYKSPLLKSN